MVAAGVAVVAVGAGLLLAARGGGDGAGSGAARSAAVSTVPTAFDLPRLGGPGEGDVRLASFRGRPVVVDFFASWCTACEGELPGFARVSRELGARVAFVGVDSLETGDGLALARRLHVDTWPLARDVDGRQGSGLHDSLGGQGMPITAFYDAAGRLLRVSPGALTEADLRSAIRELFHLAA